jgi:DNA-binding IclR family transcriptional regulator
VGDVARILAEVQDVALTPEEISEKTGLSRTVKKIVQFLKDFGFVRMEGPRFVASEGLKEQQKPSRGRSLGPCVFRIHEPYRQRPQCPAGTTDIATVLAAMEARPRTFQEITDRSGLGVVRVREILRFLKDFDLVTVEGSRMVLDQELLGLPTDWTTSHLPRGTFRESACPSR